MAQSIEAKALIKEAQDEVKKCEGEAIKKELKVLYKRRSDTTKLLASINREIELEEAKIIEIYG